mgnify:CR=1 FL=1
MKMEKTSKECNLLCSGPSRKSYIPNDLPTMGCNIPWTKVDWTIIFDSIVLEKIIDNPDFVSIDTKLIVSSHAIGEIKEKGKLKDLNHNIISIYRYNPITTRLMKKSTGHYAAEWLIFMGYNKINIYGCNNWFGDLYCTENYMHDSSNPLNIENENIPRGEKYMINRGKHWKKYWEKLIAHHSHVHFNFIP